MYASSTNEGFLGVLFYFVDVIVVFIMFVVLLLLLILFQFYVILFMDGGQSVVILDIRSLRY